MNKLFILCGMVFLGITTTPQEENSNELMNSLDLEAIGFTARTSESATDYLASIVIYSPADMKAGTLDLEAIPYEELEEEIDLGFDTREYLPEGFDPEAIYVDLKEILYLEEKTVVLQFDTKAYLPESFDAFAPPTNIMHVSYIEEEDYDLGFSTSAYLPEGFNAYTTDLDLSTIKFIEEDDFKFGFDDSVLFW